MKCFSKNVLVISDLLTGELWCRIQFTGVSLKGDVWVQCHRGVAGLRIEFSIHTVLWEQTHDELVEECVLLSLIEFHMSQLLWQRRWCCLPLGGHLLCFWTIFIYPDFITGDRGHWGHEVYIVSGWLTQVTAIIRFF